MKSKTPFRWGARSRVTFVAAFALSMATACGGGDAASGEEIEPGTFLAFESSFRGYHQWEAFPVETADGIPDSPHLAGKRTAYLNQRPPPGSTSFPVGTIIVKEIVNDALRRGLGPQATPTTTPRAPPAGSGSSCALLLKGPRGSCGVVWGPPRGKATWGTWKAAAMRATPGVTTFLSCSLLSD